MNIKQLRFASLFAGLAIVAAACGPGASQSPSGGAASPTTAASEAPSGSADASDPGGESSAPSGSAAAALEGSLTFWHSYGSGGGETGALNAVVDSVRAANPGLEVEVVEQPFDQIFNKWNTDVAAGGGPDLFIAPNDNLFTQADAGVLADLDEFLVDNPALAEYSEVAIEGSKVDGKFYMVPESLKAVALWYDAAALPEPPADSDALLAGVEDGSIKLGVNQGVYHQFGWTGAFGGQLMDDTGKCVADQGGFAEAFAYLKQLKDAGATFNTDGNALKTGFQTGELNAMIDGPWQTADFRTAMDELGGELAVAPIPEGPEGAANPFTGTDGWYINPNSENVELAVNFALQMIAPENEQVFVDEAGHVPADQSIEVTDPITQGFAESANNGLPRPQSAQFNNWWGPFGDALNKVIDTGADPAASITEACGLMNEASGL
jgi:arabinogalactan oligomer/maltooligosaccharide transport system substrate-binding protein